MKLFRVYMTAMFTYLDSSEFPSLGEVTPGEAVYFLVNYIIHFSSDRDMYFFARVRGGIT